MNNMEKLVASQLLVEMEKQADSRSEYLLGRVPAAVLSSLVPGGSLLQTIPAGLAALGTDTWDEEDADRANKSNLKALIPGVGDYRFYKRIGRASNAGTAGRHALGNAISEQVTPGLNMLGGTALGAGLGAGIGHAFKRDVGAGALLGAGAGAAVTGGSAIAMLLKGMLEKRKRDIPEQSHYDEKMRFLQHLIVPGKGTLDTMRRLRSSDRSGGEKEKKED